MHCCIIGHAFSFCSPKIGGGVRLSFDQEQKQKIDSMIMTATGCLMFDDKVVLLLSHCSELHPVPMINICSVNSTALHCHTLVYIPLHFAFES